MMPRRRAAGGAAAGTHCGLLALVILLLVLVLPQAAAFTVDVAAGASECFTAVASSGEEIFGNFEVLTEGSYAPVEVTVRGGVPVCVHDCLVWCGSGLDSID